MQQRTCPICGSTFTPATHNQRFCPPTPDQRARSRHARSPCARRALNAASAGWDPTSRPLPQPYDCATCGKHCIPGVTVVAHASRFCGQDCKAAWHYKARWQERARRQAEIKTDAQRRRDQEVTDRIMASPTRSQRAAYRRALRADPCAYCGCTPSGLDHIVPSSHGGSDDPTNWTGCCKSCNSIKGALPLLLALPFIPVATEYHALRKSLFS